MKKNARIAKELIRIAKALKAADDENTMTVSVTRTTKVEFDVLAENEDEARDVVQEMYENGEIDWENDAQEDIDIDVF